MNQTRESVLDVLRDFPFTNNLSDLERLVEINYEIGILDRFTKPEREVISKLIGYTDKFYRDKEGRPKLRNTGSDYIRHPIGVARHLYNLGADFLTVASAILHDAVEDEPEIKTKVKKIGRINEILSQPLKEYEHFYVMAGDFLERKYDSSREDIQNLIEKAYLAINIGEQFKIEGHSMEHKDFQEFFNQSAYMQEGYGVALKSFFEEEKERTIEEIHTKRNEKYVELEKFITNTVVEIGRHYFDPNIVHKFIERIRGVTRYEEDFDYNQSNCLLFENSKKRARRLHLPFVDISIGSRISDFMLRLGDRLYNILDTKAKVDGLSDYTHEELAMSGYRSLTIINYLNTFFEHTKIRIINEDNIEIPKNLGGKISLEELRLIYQLKNQLIDATVDRFLIIKNDLEKSKKVSVDIMLRNPFVLNNYRSILRSITVDPVGTDFDGNYLLLRKADAGSVGAVNILKTDIERLYTIACEFIAILYYFKTNPHQRLYGDAFYPRAKIQL